MLLYGEFVILLLNYKEHSMNDTTDITTLTIRMIIFLVIAGIFFFVLKRKKGK